MSSDEIRRIQTVYTERERALSGTIKVDETNLGNQRLVQQYRQRLKEILAARVKRRLSECRVLDVGCGYGSLLGWFHALGAQPDSLFGIDLLPNRIKIARQTFPMFTLIEGNAAEFEFPGGGFDLVTVFTVFSSILDPAMARDVAGAISRALTSDGAVVWYDMRYPNPWNPNLKAMTKSRIRELFPSFALEIEPISLLPPVARRLGRLTERGYPLLASVPMLRSHYLGLLRPCRSNGEE